MKNIDLVCKKIFRLAAGTQCEVTAELRDTALTRFAGNVISQNVAAVSTSYSVRLLDSGRTARVNFNQANDASIKHAVARALETLKRQKKDPTLLPLPGPKPLTPVKSLYFGETANLSPDFRARKAAELAKACKKSSQDAYGTLETGYSEFVVANTLGVFSKYKESRAIYGITVRDRDGFGWAEYPAFDVNKIPFGEVNESARRKARASRAPRAVRPGKYTVILEPAAAANLLTYLSAYGFNGQFCNEGRSFVCGKLGKRVLSPLLSIEDNALDGAAPGMPFDYEGQPRKRVTLVENGVLKALVHDRNSAKTAKTASTGHALQQPADMGAFPFNISVKPGKGSLEDLIKGTQRGILVTQFHYTNMLRRQTVEMTGMTRNGTFLVEDGRITFPVKNLRFTQSVVEAFTEVDAVGGQAVPCVTWGTTSCPAFRLKNFTFSSSTKF